MAVLLCVILFIYVSRKEIGGEIYLINNIQEVVSFKNVNVQLYQITSKNYSAMKEFKLSLVEDTIEKERIEAKQTQLDIYRTKRELAFGKTFAVNMEIYDRSVDVAKMSKKRLENAEKLSRLQPSIFSSPYRCVATDLNGRFEFEKLPRGEYCVYVEATYGNNELLWIEFVDTSKIDHLVLTNNNVRVRGG